MPECLIWSGMVEKKKLTFVVVHEILEITRFIWTLKYLTVSQYQAVIKSNSIFRLGACWSPTCCKLTSDTLLSTFYGKTPTCCNGNMRGYIVLTNWVSEKIKETNRTFACLWYYSPWITNICHIQMVTNQNCSWCSWANLNISFSNSIQEISISFFIGLTCNLPLVDPSIYY